MSIVRLDIKSQKKDSLKTTIDDGDFINLLAHENGIFVLGFNKNSQYDTTVAKNIFLINYNNDLKVMDTLIFVAKPKSYLTEVDFKFTSIYINKEKDIAYLNNEFSSTTTILSKRWTTDFLTGAYIDPMLGIKYYVEKGNDINGQRNFLSDSMSRITLHEKAVMPKQFSVVKNKGIYYWNKAVFYRDFSKNPIWEKVEVASFNPCRRYENGLYCYSRGNLAVIPLF